MRVFALGLALTCVLGCGSGRRSGERLAPPTPGDATTTPPTNPTSALRPDDSRNAVWWVQSAAEYAALTRQAYAVATRSLDLALADSSWTADLAQQVKGPYAGSPPAVIVDVDETILDNSLYQEQLIRDGARYSSESWQAWTLQARARAIPGALDFVRAAAARSITVFYITNRRVAEEEATRRNLAALGFDLPATPDVVLTRGERADWASGDKTARRAEVARNYRIVLLVGDNLGDFVETGTATAAERRAAADTYADFWGTKWMMLPNPMYGDWMRE